MSGADHRSLSAADHLVRRAVLSGAAVGVALGAVVLVAGLLVGSTPLVAVGVLVALVTGVGWWLVVRGRVHRAVQSVLAEVGARPVEADDAPRLANVVEGVCVANGVAEPELWAVASSASNAMALDAGGRSAVVVTDGLLDGLGLVELEGVVANLLGRIKDGSARLGTAAAALQQLPAASVVAPQRLLASGLGEQYAVRSDLEAVRLTRYPPGLRSALHRAETAGTGVAAGGERLHHLWLAPVDAAGVTDQSTEVAASTAQPLELRIAVLDEL